jgi:hypothetical protein
MFSFLNFIENGYTYLPLCERVKILIDGKFWFFLLGIKGDARFEISRMANLLCSLAAHWKNFP